MAVSHAMGRPMSYLLSPFSADHRSWSHVEPLGKPHFNGLEVDEVRRPGMHGRTRFPFADGVRIEEVIGT